MNELVRTELNILIPLGVCMAGLLLTVLVDPYIRRRERRIMLIIIIMISVLLINQYVSFYVEKIEPQYVIQTITDIIAYSIRPAILVVFCTLVDIRRRYFLGWILVLGNMAIHMTSLFSHICFWISENNHFIRGPLGYTSHVVSFLLLLRFVRLSFLEYGNTRKLESFVQIFNAFLIVLATGLDSFGGEWRFFQVSLLLPTIVICSVFQYIWLHLQYVREHEKDMMAGQRMKIMMSQMQPHFIYNSLTVIKAYLDEPQKAEEALDNFAGFLRGSIDLLASMECIEVKKEFETVNHFLYLEKERFGDKLSIEYDITDTNYKLPAFTIQALVENAISHGIRGNKGGKGTLVIKCYRKDGTHRIEVQDDGVGFHADTAMRDYDDTDLTGKHMHIGLKNVRDRLEYMCGGELCILSRPGKGTIAYVKIPDVSKERRK